MVKKNSAVRRLPKKIKADTTQDRCRQALRLLLRLKNAWPAPSLSRDSGLLFNQLEKVLRGERKGSSSKKPEAYNFFDLLPLLQRVFSSHDLLFLRRQLTHQLSIPEKLPRLFGSGEEIYSVLMELVSSIAKFAARKTEIEIKITTLQLRFGPAVEIQLANVGSVPFSESERQQLLEQFYAPQRNRQTAKGTSMPQVFGEAGGGIAYCREILKRCQGRLWFEVAKEGSVAVTLVLPAYDTTRTPSMSANVAYRYDIQVDDFAKVRQRFGVDRAQKLIGQVEHLVRTLVRFPVDFVLAFPEQGLASVIYESQEGAAQTVSTRISQRLQKETFRVGHKLTNLDFKYSLSKLV